MKQWNTIFKKNGKVFAEPQEDLPRVVKFFKEHRLKKVLDLGCGSGRHVIYLAKNGFEVYGFDISEEGIKMSREWVEKEGFTVDFKIGSIYEKLPYKNNYFDAIISTQVLHHSTIINIQKTIKEIERILKPDGSIFISVTKSKYKQRATKFKEIAPRTFVPLDGAEVGLAHYIYTKGLLIKDFRNFRIQRIWVDSGKHYCFVGELTKKN